MDINRIRKHYSNSMVARSFMMIVFSISGVCMFEGSAVALGARGIFFATCLWFAVGAIADLILELYEDFLYRSKMSA